MEITDAIREYIHKRLDSLQKIAETPGNDLLVNVEVGKTTNHHRSGDIFRAEVSADMEGVPLYAVSEQQDLYAAIDDVRDKVTAEAKKVRDKKRSAIRRGGSMAKEFVRKFFKK